MMKIIEVSSKEYGKVINKFTAVYNTPQFNDLNRDKVESIKYLLFINNKVRFGLVGGIREKVLLSPFSAPFGGFSCLKSDIKLKDLQSGVTALEDYARKSGMKEICITLAPQFYDQSLIAKYINTLYIKKFEVINIDLNYHFELAKFDSDYYKQIWRSARKNLRIALKQGMTFRECLDEKDCQNAYKVIQENRALKSVPLRMPYKQINKTAKIVDSHYFLAEKDGLPVAAAIVFIAAPQIAQVIYWGHIPNKMTLKPVNFLSFKLFEYFKDRGIEVLDVVPSTENSQPNFGLCEFKEGIGCIITPKFSFRKLLF